MTAIKPLFRLTVFAPASEDPTETTVLRPIAGAAHSDPCVTATAAGIAGAQPYLGIPKGRQGSLDYTTKRTTTGNLSIPLFDTRVTAGGSNAIRWWTAFLGDTFGGTRAKGCKWALERSLDGTAASLVPFMAGRVRGTSMSRALWLELDAKDFADDLNRPLFTGAPHSSLAYAQLPPLFPNGLGQHFANATLASPLGATIGAAAATAPGTVTVTVNTVGTTGQMILITQALLDADASTTLRLVELTNVATGVKSYYQWPRGVLPIQTTPPVNVFGGPTPHWAMTRFPIAVLPASDARTAPLPAVGTAVTVRILLDGPPTEATPILVDEVHPVQYLADLLDGKFSCAPGTATLRPLAVRHTGAGSTWATLLADPSFGTMREVIVKTEPKANDYIEKVLLQRYNLALVRDGSGRLDLIDLRRKPTLAGVVTLTDADLADGADPSWDDSRDGAVTAVVIDYYLDQFLPATDLIASGDTYPTISPTLIRSTKSSLLIPNDLSTLKDVGEKVVTIAARGDRISTGDWDFTHFGRQRLDRVQAVLAAAALDFLRPIGTGVITAKATYRLGSANAAAIVQGQYFIVQHTKLPDPASNQRGGARLMLCLSRDDRDGTIAVQWLDAGTSAVAVVPTITALASPNAYSVDVTLALNGAGDPVDLYVAITDTTVGVRPADNAAEWVLAGSVTASGTPRIINLPTGKRAWVRAQSHGTAANAKLPSLWAYAPAPGYLDLTAGTPLDLAPPDPAWTPIATTAEIIAPPSCVAFENPIRSTRTTANIFLRGAVGAGSATPLSWRYTVGNGAPSAWSTAPITGVSINVTRDPFYPTDVFLEVTQPDGQAASFTYAVAPNQPALDPGTGKVDPAQPLAGASTRFIPRATDANGWILDSNTQDSRTAFLNAMGRANVDTLSVWPDGGGFAKIVSGDVQSGSVMRTAVIDTRNANNAPSTYPTGTTNEFKDAGAIGIPGYSPLSGTYGNCRTEKPWTDASGGNLTQTFTNSDGKQWKRQAANNAANWTGSVWRVIAETQTQRFDRDTGHVDGTMQDTRGAFLNASFRLNVDSLASVLDGGGFRRVKQANVLSDGTVSTDTVDDGTSYPKQGAPANDCMVLNLQASSAGAGYYYAVWNTAGYTLQAGDELHYDIYCNPAGAVWKGGIDARFTDGSTLRDAGLFDQSGVGAHPSTDLSAWAKGKWYHRKVVLTSLAGKTSNQWIMALDGVGASQAAETRVGNVYIKRAGVIILFLYATGGVTTLAVHAQANVGSVLLSANTAAGTHRALTALDVNYRLSSMTGHALTVVGGVRGTQSGGVGSSPISSSGLVISISAHSLYVGGSTIGYNTGSLTVGATGTYYVYADDPNMAGGAVTYVATTSSFVLSQGSGRYYVGQVTVVSGGAGTGVGGGGGSQLPK